MRSRRLLGMLCCMQLLPALPVKGVPQRDPFAPVASSFCSAASPGWQLRGIVGQAGDYRAWLFSSPRRWMQKKPQEIVDLHWRVTQVSALSMTLSTTDGCQPPITMTLKGKLYDQDDNAVTAGLVQPAARKR